MFNQPLMLLLICCVYKEGQSVNGETYMCVPIKKKKKFHLQKFFVKKLLNMYSLDNFYYAMLIFMGEPM